MFRAIAAGIGMGIVVPKLLVWLDRHVQKRRRVDELMEDFIAVSIVLITYGAKEIVNGYGFLAVFVAGLTVQRSYPSSERPLGQLKFIERLEKLMEIGTILILGSILLLGPRIAHANQSLLVILLLFSIIRPVGTWVSTIGHRCAPPNPHRLHPITRLLFGWFGIRGVGSLYYLAYAFRNGLKTARGNRSPGSCTAPSSFPLSFTAPVPPR